MIPRSSFQDWCSHYFDCQAFGYWWLRMEPLPEIDLENYLAQVYTLTRRNQPPVTIQYVSSKTSLVPQQFWRSVWVSELFMESVKADQSLLSLTFLAFSQMFMRVLFNKLPIWKVFLSLSQGIGWYNSDTFLYLPKYFHLAFYKSVPHRNAFYPDQSKYVVMKGYLHIIHTLLLMCYFQ